MCENSTAAWLASMTCSTRHLRHHHTFVAAAATTPSPSQHCSKARVVCDTWRAGHTFARRATGWRGSSTHIKVAECLLSASSSSDLACLLYAPDPQLPLMTRGAERTTRGERKPHTERGSHGDVGELRCPRVIPIARMCTQLSSDCLAYSGQQLRMQCVQVVGA